MMILIQLIVLTSIWILGITISTQDKMIFYGARVWAEAKNNSMYEFLFLCHWCMSSLHTLFGFAFAIAIGIIPFEFKWVYVFYYPLVVMGSSLTCGIVWAIYKLIEKSTQYYSHKEQIEYWNIKERKTTHFKKTKTLQYETEKVGG